MPLGALGEKIWCPLCQCGLLGDFGNGSESCSYRWSGWKCQRAAVPWPARPRVPTQANQCSVPPLIPHEGGAHEVFLQRLMPRQLSLWQRCPWECVTWCSLCLAACVSLSSFYSGQAYVPQAPGRAGGAASVAASRGPEEPSLPKVRCRLLSYGEASLQRTHGYASPLHAGNTEISCLSPPALSSRGIIRVGSWEPVGALGKGPSRAPRDEQHPWTVGSPGVC